MASRSPPSTCNSLQSRILSRPLIASINSRTLSRPLSPVSNLESMSGMGIKVPALLFLVLLTSTSTVALGMQVGFYSQTCPSAESIVTAVVKEAVESNPRNAPILLRLQFHDCFVDGCDGSILVDSGGESAEKLAFGHLGVGGFEIIELAKSKLETVCEGVVSCSDIVALAARDAIFMAKGPFYNVPTGRMDGRVSNLDHAATMPDVDDSISVLKSKFQDKGLSEKDLVLLTAGAHTIGTTACFFMENRLYNFSSSAKSDPSINPEFLPELKRRCPFDGDANARLPLDPATVDKFDVKPFQNLRSGFSVLASDAILMEDPVTRGVVESYLNSGGQVSFNKDFIQSILKLGAIGVKSATEGEIRNHCSKLN